MFPKRVIGRRRLLRKDIQHHATHTTFVQCNKQILLNDMGTPPHINQSRAIRQTSEPGSIEYCVCFGGQRQHVHEYVALGQKLIQLLRANVATSTGNILERAVPATELKTQWFQATQCSSP
ncbi:hypothetical protein D3C76_1538210 [compost metagenome]